MVKINEKMEELQKAVQLNKFYDLKTSDLDCVGNLMNAIVKLKEAKKYVYLDVGTSGKYLIEDNGTVWHIKAYGQRGWCAGHIDKVIEEYNKQTDFMHERLYPTPKVA